LDKDLESYDDLYKRRQRKELLVKGAAKFDENPKAGLAFLEGKQTCGTTLSRRPSSELTDRPVNVILSNSTQYDQEFERSDWFGRFPQDKHQN